jgi:hypothetical protein
MMSPSTTPPNQSEGDQLTGVGAGTDIGDGADATRVALSFIAAIREDQALRDAVTQAVTAEAGLGAILDVAARSGYAIGADDLRAAFAIDWGLRRAFYLREPSN